MAPTESFQNLLRDPTCTDKIGEAASCVFRRPHLATTWLCAINLFWPCQSKSGMLFSLAKTTSLLLILEELPKLNFLYYYSSQGIIRHLGSCRSFSIQDPSHPWLSNFGSCSHEDPYPNSVHRFLRPAIDAARPCQARVLNPIQTSLQKPEDLGP